MQNITRIYALSKRNVILRYKNSLAGFLWGFMKPLLYLLIMIVVFSKNFPDVQNYTLYALSGLILWFFFANVTAQSVGNIVGSTGLIKALNIPALFFPLSEVISELFNLMLSFVVFLIVMKWFGLEYSPRLLLIVPCSLLFALFAFGLSLMLCSVNVFFRDVGIIWNTVQPAIFYLTPIAWPEKMIPDDYKAVIQFNPIYYFIKLGRTIFYETTLPADSLWYTCIALSVGMYLVGQFIFNRLKNQFISAI